MKKEKTNPAPAASPAAAPSALVKVRATRPVSEELGGVMYRFTTGDEFELPAARLPALGGLVTVVSFILLLLLLSFGSATAQGLQSASASGSTSATITFAGQNNPGRVVALDATSDKAASIATWRWGTNFQLLSGPVAANGTAFYVPSAIFTTNDVILAQTAARRVASLTVSYTQSVSAANLRLDRPLSVAQLAGVSLYKFSTPYTLTNQADAGATTYKVSDTNGLASGVMLATEYTNVLLVVSVDTVGNGSFTVTDTFGPVLSPLTTLYKLTNNYPLILPAAVGDQVVTAANATNLTSGEILAVGSGSTWRKKTFIDSEAITLSKVTTTGSPGIALARGDRMWLRGGIASTPIGNATVRLYGPAVFVQPRDAPAQMILDGTSACSLNQVIIDYRP